MTVIGRWQKEPNQENVCFFKKISLIHDYKKNKNKNKNILLVIAWLPYGITAEQKYSYAL